MGRSGFDLDWKRIANALSALMQRSNDDNFVIFFDRETQKFVQFTYSEKGGIFLDLPEQPLDGPAMVRATAYFMQYDISPETYEVYTDLTKTVPAGMHTSFNMDLRRDVQRATRIVFDVFEEIYLLPDFELIIKEN